MSKKSKRQDKSVAKFIDPDGIVLSFKKTSDNLDDQAAMDDIMKEIIAEIKKKFGEDSIKEVSNKK